MSVRRGYHYSQAVSERVNEEILLAAYILSIAVEALSD
jgi:hypothetical protein